MILIYTTCKDRKEAENIAKKLLDKKLIACANYFAIDSMYAWKNKLTKEKEIVLIGKTTNSKYKEAKKIIEEHHSYKIPCILKIPVSANIPYNAWLNSQL